MEMCGQDKASQDTSSATGIAGFQQKELHFLMYKIDGIAVIISYEKFYV
jgi:hypothetical protein